MLNATTRHNWLELLSGWMKTLRRESKEYVTLISE